MALKSKLGFGMMRLPVKNGDPTDFDYAQLNEMVDTFLEAGFTYFDTSFVYHNGKSEEATRKAVVERHPRDSFTVATKFPTFILKEESQIEPIFAQQLENLGVDYIDYYLLHSIGGGGVENLQKRFIGNGLLDFLLKEREAGRIRHLGFSYHGDVSAFDWLLDRHEQYHWDFVQIQMNYLDWRHAGRRGRRGGDADAEYLYGRLEKLGIQVVVMEPIRGGALANVADEIRQQLQAVRPDDSPATWGFRWVGSHPNILTTLSGMNRMEHLEENVSTFSPLQPCTDAENELLARIADQMAGFPTIGCTTCGYCMPCPYGVDIPSNFAFYNKAVNEKMLPLPEPTAAEYAERQEAFIKAYREAIPAEKRATTCIDCGQCLSKCPQQIRIPNQMSRIVELTRKRRK